MHPVLRGVPHRRGGVEVVVQGGVEALHLRRQGRPVEVRERRVRFNDSPCVGRLCVHTGWLDHSGEVAACLPNGVVVEVGAGVTSVTAQPRCTSSSASSRIS